jgi:pyruvate/2-oxoglutarate dehydrogenase complex dihydrolipoamide acyltransferase (E2) component
LTLAVDHRVLDGAQAAAFLRDLKAQIEHGQI